MRSKKLVIVCSLILCALFIDSISTQNVQPNFPSLPALNPGKLTPGLTLPAPIINPQLSPQISQPLQLPAAIPKQPQPSAGMPKYVQLPIAIPGQPKPLVSIPGQAQSLVLIPGQLQSQPSELSVPMSEQSRPPPGIINGQISTLNPAILQLPPTILEQKPSQTPMLGQPPIILATPPPKLSLTLAPNQSETIMKPQPVIPAPGMPSLLVPVSSLNSSSGLGPISSPSEQLILPNGSNITPVLAPATLPAASPQVPPYALLPPDLLHKYLVKLTQLEEAKDKGVNATSLNQTQYKPVTSAPAIKQQNEILLSQPKASATNQSNVMPISQQNAIKMKMNVLTRSQPNATAINQQNILSFDQSTTAPNQTTVGQNKPIGARNQPHPSSAAANFPKKIQLESVPLSASVRNPAGLTPLILTTPNPQLPAGLQQPGVIPAGLQQPGIIPTSLQPPGIIPVGLQQPAIGQPITQEQPTLAKLDQLCGVPSRRAYETRIVGGTEVELDSWPWMAAIFLNDRFDYVACAGALISNQFVLTAAHCMLDSETHKLKNATEYTIRLGEHDFSRTDDGAFPIDHKIIKLIPYPEYDPTHKLRDVGLIQLSSPVAFTDSIIPVCLPTTPEVTNTTFYTQRAHIVGWGFTSYGTYSNFILRNATVRVTQLWKCKAIYQQFNYTVDDSQICAGNNKIPVDVCQGDSGGPLVLEDARKRMNVIGVISYGVRCAQEGFPGVYTKISFYLPWIKKEANIL